MKIALIMSDYYWKKGSLVALLVLIVLSGCVSTKETTYLQDLEESEYSGEYTPPNDYLIQPNDNLYIRVSTPDPSRSELFNAMGEGGSMSANEASAQLLSYPVELDGSVDLPYVGSIVVAGKTIAEAKIAIEDVLKDYVTDASLTVKLVNNYVSVLGEVSEPGMYPIYKERLNIYQALAMAGDAADFGDRTEVSIIRKTGEGSIIKEFNITDRNIVDSEFYYVMPNDVIYVKAVKGRFFGINTAPWTFALSTLTATLTLFVLIQNSIILRQ